MNIEEFRDYCLSKKGVTEEFPFDGNTLVFKVMGKMFALADVEEFESINLKCDPEKAIELREKFSSIIPGFHMNKKHWNTIVIDGQLNNKFIFNLIHDSYSLVVQGLNKKTKDQLNEM